MISFNNQRFSKVLVTGVYSYKRVIYVNEIDVIDLLGIDEEVEEFRAKVFGEGGLSRSYLFLGGSIDRVGGGVINKLVIEGYIFRNIDVMMMFDLVNNCLTNKN
mgnify:CR=1 FL=1